METDQFNRNAVEDREAPVDYLAPINARHYPILGNDPNVVIIPLRNILLDDSARITLYELSKNFDSPTFDPSKENLERLQQLDIDLRELYRSFKSQSPIRPIEVRSEVVISNPSPSDPTLPTSLGFGAPLINIYPISTDFLYKIIDGADRVALSIYFGYDHIPIITRI